MSKLFLIELLNFFKINDRIIIWEVDIVKIKRIVAILMVFSIVLSFAGCSKVDKSDNNSTPNTVSKPDYANIKIPEIKSEDQIMPTYVDISIYDVENYADLYLGKKYKFKITYSGSELTVPITYKEMQDKDWTLIEENEITADSNIMAGKYQQVRFKNEYNTELIGVFYNSSKSSKSLKKCKIVKFIIPENKLENPESVYGDFWVNGVSNNSAITDVIECLGAPSHFYAVSSDEYYLDYFLFEEDKRNKITVYINPEEDSVKSIYFARFE